MQQPGLGAHLHGDHPGELQIVELLFKPVAHLHEIVIGLGVLLGTGLLRLGLQGREFVGLDIRQLPLARQDIHGELLVVLEIELIHLVKHGHVFQKRHLVLFQLPDDLVHIGLYLGILGLHGLQLVAGLFEKAEEPLLLLFLAEALELHHQLGEGLAHLSQVLGTYGVQGVFRKARHILLGSGAILEDHLGVRQVDFLGKGLHCLLFRIREQILIHLHRGHFRLGLLLRGRRRCLRRQGQLRHGLRRGIGGERQLLDVFLFISHGHILRSRFDCRLAAADLPQQAQDPSGRAGQPKKSADQTHSAFFRPAPPGKAGDRRNHAGRSGQSVAPAAEALLLILFVYRSLLTVPAGCPALPWGTSPLSAGPRSALPGPSYSPGP